MDYNVMVQRHCCIKVSEFQNQDHVSKHATSCSYLYMITQFCKLFSCPILPAIFQFFHFCQDLPGPGAAASPLQGLTQTTAQFMCCCAQS